MYVQHTHTHTHTNTHTHTHIHMFSHTVDSPSLFFYLLPRPGLFHAFETCLTLSYTKKLDLFSTITLHSFSTQCLIFRVFKIFLPLTCLPHTIPRPDCIPLGSFLSSTLPLPTPPHACPRPAKASSCGYDKKNAIFLVFT